MAKKQSGLGRGLDVLFTETDIVADAEQSQASDGSLLTVRISDIEPDKAQPRKHFDEAALQTLADSIAEHGVLQPLVVRTAARPDDTDEIKEKLAGKYRIVSGERRWRASKLAGLTELPVVVRELSDTEAGAIMLVENLQREDLNPVETAEGLKRLIEEFGMTHEEAAKAVGISRPNLTNLIRLLALPSNALSFLEDGSLSVGHARALLALENEKAINDAVDVILAKQYSVRATEKYVKYLLEHKDDEPKVTARDTLDRKVYMEKLGERITASLGRKATLTPNGRKKGAGRIEIEYYDSDDLENLLKSICGSGFFDEE